MSDGRTWGTVIGGIIGYFVPVIGWAAGAAIGGAVGGLLEPTKKVEQGRIDDLKVSVSQYGAGIPETWGNNVPPATWVWATDVIEIGQTQGGGKGGGGTEVTQYRQFIHGYLVLGRTPPVGSTIQIRKAWVDGKLTYDASSGLSVAQALASEENPFAQISLHPGWEDQIPHPIMEFYEGIGNTPAYRGVVGVFVFGLECPGGRIPQLSFEIVTNANFLVERSEFCEVPPGPENVNAATAIIGSETIWHIQEVGNVSMASYGLKISRCGPGYSRFVYSVPSPFWGNGGLPIPVDGGSPALIRCKPGANTNAKLSVYRMDIENGGVESEILAYVPGSSANILGTGLDVSAAYDQTGEYYAVRGGGSTRSARITFIKDRSQVLSDEIPGTRGPVAAAGGHGYALSHDGGNLVLSKFDPEDGALLQSYSGPAVSSPGMSWACLHADQADGAFGGVLYAWLSCNSGEYHLYKIANGIWTLISDEANAGPNDKVSQPTTFYADGRRCVIGPSTSVGGDDHVYTMVNFNVLTPAEAPISLLIESQCDRVGLSGKTDLLSIDDTVWGYTFNKSPASARNNIAPLLTYAGVAQVEEDGIIRFFHRGDKTPVATIGYDELGCTEDGQEPGDPFPLTRTQEAECPRSVTVQYVNPFFDYQTSTETARRIVTDSELDETVTLDVAMTPDKAATIAHRTLYERWIARDTRSFKVSRKFAALSPGDVVTIEYPRGTTGNYMLAKVNDTGALIEAECVPADAELLTQSIPGTNGYTGQQIAPLAPPTLLTVVDSRILRDADNNAGLYAAMAGFGPGWSGSELWAGDDANALVDRGGVTTEAVQGVCETTLGAYTLGNVDEHNLLTVNVGNGALSTITRDALLNGSANVAVVGAPGRWEVIKFQRADDLGSGRYILSGLLRGLQGSEFAIAQHASGDRFVFMSDGGVLRPNFEPGTIGQDMAFKVVSVGRRFDSASVQTAENTGEGLRPSSPTTLRKSFSTNDIVLTWGRRTRLAQQWWLGNVPLGEESERYEIDIFSDNTYTTVKRTLTSTSSTVTYTSAQQVADFGSNQTTVYVRIYQMSGTVGRGHELQQAI